MDIGTQHILLVRVAKGFSATLEQTLKQEGYHPLTATTATDALAYFKSYEISAIILIGAKTQKSTLNEAEVLSWHGRAKTCPLFVICPHDAAMSQRLSESRSAPFDIISSNMGWEKILSNVLSKLAYFTDTQTLNHALQEVTSHYQTLLEHEPHAIVTCDPNGIMTQVNPSFATLLQKPLTELAGQPWLNALSATDKENGYGTWTSTALYKTCAMGDVFKQAPINLIDAHFNPVSVSLIATPVFDDLNQLNCIQILMEDISETLALKNQLIHVHQRCPVTGLPNYEAFEAMLEKYLAHAKRSHETLGVCVFRLDTFNQINAHHGKKIATALLHAVQERLVRVLRLNDFIAKTNEAEFAIILDDIQHPDHAADVAAKLIITLEKPYQISDRTITIASSIGLSTYPSYGETASAVFEQAHIAMEKAQALGQHTFKFYNETMKPDSISALEDRE